MSGLCGASPLCTMVNCTNVPSPARLGPLVSVAWQVSALQLFPSLDQCSQFYVAQCSDLLSSEPVQVENASLPSGIQIHTVNKILLLQPLGSCTHLEAEGLPGWSECAGGGVQTSLPLCNAPSPSPLPFHCSHPQLGLDVSFGPPKYPGHLITHC